jgi:hypothetical protein
MDGRNDLREERGWVIVTKDRVLEFDTFTEAAEVNKLMSGHLMSKNYFENHYKNENL